MPIIDQYALDESLSSYYDEIVASKRYHVYINDTNGGSYTTGEVNFDCTKITSEGYNYLKKAIENVPYAIQVSIPTTGTALAVAKAENDFCASLKAGHFNLVNSVKVMIDDQDCTNYSDFTNLHIQYKILSKSSREDEINLLPSFGYVKDSTQSIQYKTAPSPYGIGQCNNCINPSVVFSPTSGWGTVDALPNTGRIARMLKSNVNLDRGTVSKQFTTNEKIITNCYRDGVVANTTGYIQFHVLAQIPLEFVHDIFDKMPMTKGSRVKLTLKLHTGTSTVTLGANTATYTAYSTTSATNYFPVQLSPLTAPNSGDTVKPSGNGAVFSNAVDTNISKVDNTSITVTGSIVYLYGTTLKLSGLSCCQLVVPMCELNPVVEQRYLSSMPKKTITYDDLVYVSKPNDIQASSSFSIDLPAQSNIKYLLLVPLLKNNASVYNTSSNTITSTSSPLLSPFAGTELAPYVKFIQFQVYIDNVPFFPENQVYDFQQYLHQIRPSMSMNAGQVLGASSGLLSFEEWQSGYGYIFVDLSRTSSLQLKQTSRQIRITGTNTLTADIDLRAFICYERTISLSTATGSLVA